MVNEYSLMTLAKIRQDEMLQQAAQLRLVKQAASSNRGRAPLRGDLRAAVMTLGARLDAMRKRRGATNPINVTPAAPETM